MHVFRFVIVCVVLAVSACNNSSLPALGSDAVILAFGDSLTKGKGTSAENSYPAVLARLSSRTVINAGISGETTAAGLLRLPGVLEDTSPDLMLLMHGGNDILQNLSLTAAKKNLQAMIRLAQERDIAVVLIGVPEKKLFSSSAAYYRELAESHELPFAPNIISSLLRKPRMKSDAVHFNAAGYAEMAQKIYTLLQANGAM